MDITVFEDILNKSMNDAGWPDVNFDAFDLEYGTETSEPRPAIRRSIPAIADEIAMQIDSSIRNIMKR